MGLSSILSKTVDSASSGFLKKALTGAGLGLASTAGVTVLVNSYIANLRTSTGGLSSELYSHIASISSVIMRLVSY